MNRVIILFAVGFLFASSHSTKAQGTFHNLNFESPILPLIPDGDFSVPIANALPNWIGYLNGSPVARVGYNSLSISGPSVSLVDSSWPAIQGSYSVFLKSFSDQGGTSAAIGQTGQIPNSAASLFFLSSSSGSFIVSFAGRMFLWFNSAPREAASSWRAIFRALPGRLAS